MCVYRVNQMLSDEAVSEAAKRAVGIMLVNVCETNGAVVNDVVDSLVGLSVGISLSLTLLFSTSVSPHPQPCIPLPDATPGCVHTRESTDGAGGRSDAGWSARNLRHLLS